jgi:hypothetical protein
MSKAERKPLADPLGPSMLDLNGDACTKKLRSLLVQRRVKRRFTQGELAMRLGKVQSHIAKMKSVTAHVTLPI